MRKESPSPVEQVNAKPVRRGFSSDIQADAGPTGLRGALHEVLPLGRALSAVQKKVPPTTGWPPKTREQTAIMVVNRDRTLLF
jgi:hypothetical protein